MTKNEVTISKIRAGVMKPEIDWAFVAKCHTPIPDRIRKYLNDRGITDKIIERKEIGWGRFFGKNWITIPIKNEYEAEVFLKLRKDPGDKTNKDKYKIFPTGSPMELYGRECLTNSEQDYNLVICEGEFDCMILEKFGFPAVTSTAGPETFKKEWLSDIRHISHIFIVLDKDEAGKRGSEELIKLISNNMPRTSISQIYFPDEMKDGEDVSDYFSHYNGDRVELIEKFAKIIKLVDPYDDIPLEKNHC